MHKYLVPVVLTAAVCLGLPYAMSIHAGAQATAAPETQPDPAVPAETPVPTPALPEGHMPSGNLACGTCHVSDHPQEGAPAELKACPRTRALAAEGHSSSEAPDVILIDKLADIYVPVVFPHKLHASMTEMAGGCETCHHRNPPGPILACGACHGGPSNPAHLRQPSLKGAYHRQCLGCHREWTHETDCGVCHAKASAGVVPQLPKDPTDIMGMLHPNVEVPDTNVYTVEDLADTPVVTFHHKLHTVTFGLKCAECHRQENCSSCHDTENPVERVRQDPHQDCAQCHQPEIESNCMYCHKEKETPAVFNHQEFAEYSLEPWHGTVGCRQCHTGDALRFTPTPVDCDACHSVEWSPADGAFDHAVTGQPLDGLHEGASCQDCHTQGMGRPVTCNTCHDDGRTRFEPVADRPDTPTGEDSKGGASPASETKS